jgi:hypothetical protein
LGSIVAPGTCDYPPLWSIIFNKGDCTCTECWPNSFINEVPQYIDSENSCSQFAYAELKVGDSPRAPYYDGQTQPIPWKPGYPDALTGLDWKWVTSRTYKNANWGGTGVACASVEGLSEPFSVYEYNSKTALLLCTNGQLTDITSDAVEISLFKVDSVRSAGTPDSGECFPPFACSDYTGECGTSYNILEHQYTEGHGACDGGFIIIKMGGSADWQVDPGPRPPLPTEL